MSRVERFAGLIREEISEILRDEVSDPRIGFVSITGVDISPDMKNARIYVSIFGSEKEKDEAMHGLASATGYIRSKLAQMLETRNTPELRFIRDDSIERGSKVLGIISKLEHEKESLSRNKKGRKKR
jgi:ribosome-binding factor A